MANREILPCVECVDKGLASPITENEEELVSRGLLMVCSGERDTQVYMQNRGYFENGSPILEVITDSKCPERASSPTKTCFG